MSKKLHGIQIAALLLYAGCAVPALAHDDDQHARGVLTALSAVSVTVGSLTCKVDTGTRYEGSNENAATAADFSIGDEVKLSCRSGIAREIELERENEGNPSPSPSASASPKASPEDHDDHGDDQPGKHDVNEDNGGKGGKGNDDDGPGRGRENSGEFKKRLSAPDGVNTAAKGRVEYKVEGRSKKSERRFRAWVKLQLPSVVPAAATVDAASALVLDLTLSRGGTAYAHCTLDFDNPADDNADDDARAQFRLDLRQRGTKYSEKRGTCDTDLATDGIQAGVPEPQKGDLLTIDETIAGVFLTGSL